ncbi:hypothetical protein JCM8097_008849 [Rhodosporidiobolus ruineniae]
MSALPPPAVDASTRLLRVLASLVVQLDPVKGIKATTLKALAEDIEDIGKEHGEGSSSDVVPLLTSADASLSNPDGVSVTYTACLAAQTSLARALELLALPPPPLSPSPFLRLPAELVARIVDFCQTDDLRLRQSTNLALSRTCRLFRRHAAPILATEMSLFTAGQIERAAAAVAAKSSNELVVKDLVIDVALRDIERRSQAEWAGRRIMPLVDRLLEDCSLRTLQIHIRQPPSPEERFDPPRYREDVLAALGTDTNWYYYQFPNVEELHLPSLFNDVSHNLFDPPAALRHLGLGVSSPPATVPPEDQSAVLMAAQTRRAEHGARGGAISDINYEVLAMPYIALFPRDLRALVLPPSLSTPTLTHLEITVCLDNSRLDCEAIAAILRSLAPSLRRLALRTIVVPAAGQIHNYIDDFQLLVPPALATCTSLEHFEIGGECVDNSVFSSTGIGLLPRLRTLFVLPLTPHRGGHYLGPHIRCMAALRHLTVLTPILSTLSMTDVWNNRLVEEITIACEERGIELVIKEETAERAWLLGEE